MTKFYHMPLKGFKFTFSCVAGNLNVFNIWQGVILSSQYCSKISDIMKQLFLQFFKVSKSILWMSEIQNNILKFSTAHNISEVLLFQSCNFVHFSHNFFTVSDKLIWMTNFWCVHQWRFKLTLSCAACNSDIFHHFVFTA